MGAGTVGVDGRTGIAEQGGYLLGGVYAKTNEGIYSQLRGERFACLMHDLMLWREKPVEIIHESREKREEGGVESTVK